MCLQEYQNAQNHYLLVGLWEILTLFSAGFFFEISKLFIINVISYKTMQRLMCVKQWRLHLLVCLELPYVTTEPLMLDVSVVLNKCWG